MIRRLLVGVPQDAILAARLLTKDIRFTFAAVAALALAIGVNNSVFTLINTAILRDLPFADPDRLVAIKVPNPRGFSAMSFPDFRDVAANARTVRELTAINNAAMIVSEPDLAPERLRGAVATPDLFRTLGVAPILGRGFVAEDGRVGAQEVVVIGHGVWQRRYGGDPGVIGRPIRINNRPATIVGVMPPGFSFPMIAEAWQVVPLLTRGLPEGPRDARFYVVVGRLTPDAELTHLRRELQGIAGQLAATYPATNASMQIEAAPLRDDYGAVSLSILLTFLGAVFLVLLVACANLANLLLARSASRGREIAIRTALGATRWRVVRQLMVECVFIAVLAGLVGALLSMYGARTIAAGFDVYDGSSPAAPVRPFWVDLSFNGFSYLFIGLLCVFATLACGLVPALHVSRRDLNEAIKSGANAGTGRSARRWIGSFIVAEVTLTLVLLAGAGLLWRSFLVQYATDTVIDIEDLTVMRLSVPMEEYDTEERARFFDQLDTGLQAMPVAAATLANVAPFDFDPAGRRVTVDGRAPVEGDTLPPASYIVVGRRYIETVRLPILRGRAFTRSDALPGQAGAIVDERFAAAFFGNDDPIGRSIRVAPAERGLGFNAPGSERRLTIVGVAKTVPQTGPPPFRRPVVYALMAGEPSAEAAVSLLIRDESGPGAVASLVREEIRRLDDTVPVFAVQTMEEAVARERYATRLIGSWFGAIAVIALVLASVGLYALTAQGVVQRTREIGIRIALGARPRQVLWLFLRRASLYLAIGLILGTAGALAAGQLLQTFLEGVSPRDPTTLLSVAALLIVVTALASLLPARRAARVDPVIALRVE